MDLTVTVHAPVSGETGLFRGVVRLRRSADGKDGRASGIRPPGRICVQGMGRDYSGCFSTSVSREAIICMAAASMSVCQESWFSAVMKM